MPLLCSPPASAVLLLALLACSSTAPGVMPLPEPTLSMITAMPADTAFAGRWQLDAERSTSVDPWRDFSVEIALDGDAVILKRLWRGSREGGATVDSVRVVPGGGMATAKLDQWPDNRHLGAYLAGDSTKTVTARWADEGRTLVTESTLTLSIQQGTRTVRIYTEYRLEPSGDELTVLELRSTRPRPLHYVFTRAGDHG